MTKTSRFISFTPIEVRCIHRSTFYWGRCLFARSNPVLQLSNQLFSRLVVNIYIIPCVTSLTSIILYAVLFGQQKRALNFPQPVIFIHLVGSLSFQAAALHQYFRLFYVFYDHVKPSCSTSSPLPSSTSLASLFISAFLLLF